MKFFVLSVMFILIIGGCGSSEPTDTSEETNNTDTGTNGSAAQEEYVLPIADNYLTVSDSIGVELGDSNFVFGAIIAAGFTNNGDVAILDMQKTSISLFSYEGEFIRSIGREGGGPGEFRMPVAFACYPDGGMVVADGMGGKLVYFDENYDYIDQTAGFVPSPPAQIIALTGTDIMGLKPDFEQTEDGMFMGFTVARWNNESSVPTQIFYSKMSPFNPTDLSTMTDDILLFTATEDGLVFTSPMSSEDYSFTAWSADGEELFTYEKDDFERVAKSQYEIDLETEVVNARMIAQGMPASMANWEPDPYKASIAGLFVDGQNRLWISKGTESVNAFDVFDLDGNLLFTAAIDAGEAAMKWTTFIGKEHFISFDVNPDDYPRVFYGSLPE